MMAERGGFEPPIPLRVCLISSQVHSTGLCHLSDFSKTYSATLHISAFHGFRRRTSGFQVGVSWFLRHHPAIDMPLDPQRDGNCRLPSGASLPNQFLAMFFQRLGKGSRRSADLLRP